MKNSVILVATTILTILLLSTIVLATGNIIDITSTSAPDVVPTTSLMNSINANNANNENSLVNDTSNLTNDMNTIFEDENTINYMNNTVDDPLFNDVTDEDTNTLFNENETSYNPDDNTVIAGSIVPASDVATQSSGLDTGSIINIFMIVVGIVIILLGFAILVRSK